MIIYKVTNQLTGKLYIGQTIVSLKERWGQHCNNAPRKSHKSALHNAIRKYGKDNFKIEEIDSAKSIYELNSLEIKYIEKFNTLSPNGYNLLKGGDNRECHKDTKEKIRAKLKGQPIKNRMNGAPKGRKVSEERKSQISKTMTGVPQPWKYKKVLVVETGVVYESVQSAARALGIGRPGLSLALKTGSRNRKTGYTFKFS